MARMHTENPIHRLIARWPSRRIFAGEVGADVEAVHKWARSGRVPSGFMKSVQSAAAKRGFADVTADWLLSVHDQGSEKPQEAAE
ncbi:MAG: hypothetical protein ACK5X3_19590 [Pseudomonadota bacterium]